MRNLVRQGKRRFSQAEIEELVTKSVDLICSIVKPQDIYLIGSATTGNFDDESDLDFVLIFPTIAEAKAAERGLYARTTLFPCPVDFICVDRQTYLKKSEIGGVFFTCRESGRKIERP